MSEGEWVGDCVSMIASGALDITMLMRLFEYAIIMIYLSIIIFLRFFVNNAYKKLYAERIHIMFNVTTVSFGHIFLRSSVYFLCLLLPRGYRYHY